jgi:hypothetical protein
MARNILINYKLILTSYRLSTDNVFTSPSSLVMAMVMMLSFTNLASANLINAGFETGTIAGWTANNGSNVNVVNSTKDYNSNVYAPVEGSYFALLFAGLGDGVPTTLSQTVHMNAGDTLKGSAAFLAFDYLPFTDWGKVNVSYNNTDVWFKNIPAVGSYGSSPWEQWVYVAPISGDYTLSYQVANGGDNSMPSRAIFDAQLNPVPLPPSVWLFGSGLVGLIGLRRFKRS